VRDCAREVAERAIRSGRARIGFRPFSILASIIRSFSLVPAHGETTVAVGPPVIIDLSRLWQVHCRNVVIPLFAIRQYWVCAAARPQLSGAAKRDVSVQFARQCGDAV
jgi:hypothetical protein